MGSHARTCQARQLTDCLGHLYLKYVWCSNTQKLPCFLSNPFYRDMCLEYGRMAHIGVPRLSLDKLHEIEQDAVWVPYRPRSNHIDLAREPAFLHHVMAGLADLANTLADIQNLFLVEAPDMSIHQIWEKASQLYDRVEVYRKGLGDPVMIDDHPVPQILYLRYEALPFSNMRANPLLQYQMPPCLNYATGARSGAARL